MAAIASAIPPRTETITYGEFCPSAPHSSHLSFPTLKQFKPRKQSFSIYNSPKTQATHSRFPQCHSENKTNTIEYFPHSQRLPEAVAGRKGHVRRRGCLHAPAGSGLMVLHFNCKNEIFLTVFPVGFSANGGKLPHCVRSDSAAWNGRKSGRKSSKKYPHFFG